MFAHNSQQYDRRCETGVYSNWHMRGNTNLTRKYLLKATHRKAAPDRGHSLYLDWLVGSVAQWLAEFVNERS